jgi:hypothetical protein
MSTNVKKHNTASASRIAHRYVQSALIGDSKELLEIYESKLKLYEGEARTAQEIQDFIDKNIESQADEIGLSYSRMNAELRSGKPNLWNELATIWESNRNDFNLKFESMSLAKSHAWGFENLKENAQPLFWSILQQFSLPANITKKVQAAAKYWDKSKLGASPRDKRPWAYVFDYKEHPASFLKNLGIWREHLALARECLAKGVPHGDGTKSKVQAGPFMLINTGSFSDEIMENVKQAVLKAVKAMTSIGLGKVCYGDMLVSKKISASGNILAFYVITSDEMFVRADAKATHDIVKTICHELAHRFQYKFSVPPRDIKNLYDTIARSGESNGIISGWPEIGRKVKFKGLDLIVTKVEKTKNKITLEQHPAPGLAKPTYSAPIEWWAENIDVGAKLEHSPDFKGFISPYAKDGGPGENFAEMVAYHALGELPAPLVSLLKPLIS